MPVTKVCEHCKLEFQARSYRAESQRWCSWRCKTEAHKVAKTCLHCGKEFSIYASQERKGLGQFCTKACKDLNRTLPKKPKVEKEVVMKTCVTCGKTFRVPPVRKESAKYCSRECKWADPAFLGTMSQCQTGDKNPRWTGGVYERGTGYVVVRNSAGFKRRNVRHQHTAVMLTWILEEAPDHPFLVEIDGAKRFAPGIEIHHIDRNRGNNVRGNLLAVAREAHARIHNYGTKPQPWECWPSHPANW